MPQLIPHPAFPPARIASVEARVTGMTADWLSLRWKVVPGAVLKLPPFAGRKRADGLWRKTCFELFVKRDGSDGYSEFNLSPSEAWAAYDFDSYRAGMRDRPVERAPACSLRNGSSCTLLDVHIPADAIPAGPATIGLSAVLEETCGTLSFWALAHPEASRQPQPDFHDPACFAGRLAAPEAP